MIKVFVRVLELRTEETHSRLNKLLFIAETRSSQKSVQQAVSGTNFLTCSRCWEFSIPSQASETLSLTLEKRRIFSRNKLVGRCVLPMSWFPTHRVVREWFPMVNDLSPAATDSSTMVLLDVHVDNQKVKKFKAAFSNLRVIPTWQRPVDQSAECPAPPQVIYVIHDQTHPQQPRFIPVGTAQYPSPQMLQYGPMAPAPPPYPMPYQVQGQWTAGASFRSSQSSIIYPPVSIRDRTEYESDIPPVYA
jgi:hypothetical protein